MFTYSSLLVTMCRNFITFLRETFVGHYVPFDSNIAFHKYVAMWALIFTGIVPLPFLSFGNLAEENLLSRTEVKLPPVKHKRSVKAEIIALTYG